MENKLKECYVHINENVEKKETKKEDTSDDIPF
jgi:hypothetical protein